jgi:hypothetical protein
VRVSDLDLSHLVFLEAPSAPNATVFLRGDQYFIGCPVGDDSLLGADGAGRVTGCEVEGLRVDVRNPIALDIWRSTLTAATFTCRTGSTLRFIDTELVRPTFHCRPEQLVFGPGRAAPADARWCHPDDDPAETRERAPPVYASGPCAGEPYPFYLDQHIDLGLPGTR